MQRSSVDLPEPLGPITQTTSPLVDVEVDAAEHLEVAEALADVLRGCSIGPSTRLIAQASSPSPAPLAVPVAGGPAASASSAPCRRALVLRLVAGDQPVDQARQRDRDDQEQQRAEHQRRSR